MTLEEEIKEMADRILNGDKTVDVTDIVKLITNRMGKDGSIQISDIPVKRENNNENR